MSSNSSKYRFEHEMAPHVDPKWAATFTMELNIRQAAGEEIGAALAEVDSHCAESGESAQEAFGDPIEYASQLELSSQPVKKQHQMGIALPQMFQAAGMLGVLWALLPFARGEAVTLHAGELGLLVLCLATIAALAWQAQLVVRLVGRKPVTAVILGAGILAAMILTAALLRHPVAEVPAGGLLGFGGVILAVATIWGLQSIRGLSTSEGMITSPLEDESTLQRRVGSARRAGYIPVLMMPGYTALLALALWIFA